MCQELWGCQEPPWPGDIWGIFRIDFVTWLMFMKCLWQIRSRELWIRQRSVVASNERGAEEGVDPCVQHTFVVSLVSPPWCWTRAWAESWMSLQRETEMALLGRGEGAQAAECLCSCLVSASVWGAHSIVVLLQEPFFVGSGPADGECPSSISLRQKDDTCAVV